MSQETLPSTHHVSAEAAPRVAPPFLFKLYAMLDDESINDLIYWSPDGDSFFISGRGRSKQEWLGDWFKHKSYSSFVRQLNNHGFHKIPHLQQGALRSDTANDPDHYMHYSSLFRRGQKDLLSRIQRRKDRKARASPMAQLPRGVRDLSPSVSTPEIVPAGDTAQDLLLKKILLDVDSLKDRQMELETENRCLHDEVGAMQQQLEFLLQLLTGSGVTSLTEPDRMKGGDEPLMIQGAPGKVEAGGMTGFHTLADGPSDPYTVTSPPSTPPSASPGAIHQAHSSNSNSPVFTERAPSHSPPPTPPSISGGHMNQSISHPEFAPGNHEAFLFGPSTPEYSTQVHNFQGNLTSSFSESYSSETPPNHYDFDTPKFVNPPAESVRDCMTSYGMGENDISAFYLSPGSSITGSAGGVVSGSDMHVTSYTPTDIAVSARGVKRKVMDGLERTEPECAPHTSPLSLYPYDTPSWPPAEFFLLPLNDQPSAPRSHLMPDPTLAFYGPENESRSPKRARCTPENF